MGETDFAARYGFGRREVTLANWRTAPFSRWSFQNVAEIVPSAIRAPADPRPEEPAEDPALLQAPLGHGGATVADHLAAHDTDLFCVMKSGRVLADWAAPHADPALPHLVFSISKSLTALVAGALSGISGASAAVGGPFTAILFQHEPTARMRSTLAVSFLLGSALSTIGLAQAGALDWSDLRAALAWVPFMVVGYAASGRLRRRLAESGMRTAVLAFCVIAACVIVIRALAA